MTEGSGVLKGRVLLLLRTRNKYERVRKLLNRKANENTKQNCEHMDEGGGGGGGGNVRGKNKNFCTRGQSQREEY